MEKVMDLVHHYQNLLQLHSTEGPVGLSKHMKDRVTNAWATKGSSEALQNYQESCRKETMANKMSCPEIALSTMSDESNSLGLESERSSPEKSCSGSREGCASNGNQTGLRTKSRALSRKERGKSITENPAYGCTPITITPTAKSASEESESIQEPGPLDVPSCCFDITCGEEFREPIATLKLRSSSCELIYKRESSRKVSQPQGSWEQFALSRDSGPCLHAVSPVSPVSLAVPTAVDLSRGQVRATPRSEPSTQSCSPSAPKPMKTSPASSSYSPSSRTTSTLRPNCCNKSKALISSPSSNSCPGASSGGSDEQVTRKLATATPDSPLEVTMVVMRSTRFHLPAPGINKRDRKRWEEKGEETSVTPWPETQAKAKLLPMGMLVTALFSESEGEHKWLYIRTPHGREGYINAFHSQPICSLPSARRCKSNQQKRTTSKKCAATACEPASSDTASAPAPGTASATSTEKRIRGKRSAPASTTGRSTTVILETKSSSQRQQSQSQSPGRAVPPIKPFNDTINSEPKGKTRLKTKANAKVSATPLEKASRELKVESTKSAKSDTQSETKEGITDSPKRTGSNLLVVTTSYGRTGEDEHILGVEKGEIVSSLDFDDLISANTDWLWVKKTNGAEGYIPHTCASRQVAIL